MESSQYQNMCKLQESCLVMEEETEYLHDEYMDKDPSPYDGDYSEV